MAKSASSFKEAKLTQKQFASSTAIACPNRLARRSAATQAWHKEPYRPHKRVREELTIESLLTACLHSPAYARAKQSISGIKPRRKKFRMASDPFAIVRVKSPAGV